MNPPKCKEEDYIDFLIATQKAYRCTEVARVQPNEKVSHDAILRMLHRIEPTSESLLLITKENYMNKLILTLFPALFFLSGCAISMIMVNTSGQATDVSPKFP